MKPILLLSLFLPMITGCQETASKFLGRTGVVVLRQPTKIEAWRIQGGRGAPQTALPAKELDIAVAQQLAAILLDSGTYDFESAKACTFDPAVGFRIWHDKRSIEIILCFHCNQLKLVSPDPLSTKYPSRIEEFDNARPAIVSLVKQVFTGDTEIQALR